MKKLTLQQKLKFKENKILIIKNDLFSIEEQVSMNISMAKYVNSENVHTSTFLIKDHNHKNLDHSYKNEGFNSENFWSKSHIDLPPDIRSNSLCALISMNMNTFTCSPGNGNTYYLNMCKAFDFLNIDPTELVDLKISFSHDNKNYITPIIYRHFNTGETVLFWPKKDSKYHSGNWKIFNHVQKSVKDYLGNYDNWYEHQWSENDLVFFDNTCMLHSFTSGWSLNQRSFHQVVTGTYSPIFLYNKKNLWESHKVKSY